MLKKIDVSELRLGMHLHALGGSWLSHPFWRTKFVLTDEADLQAVFRSGVRACWIDPDKGLDTAVMGAPPPPAPGEVEAAVARPAPAPATAGLADADARIDAQADALADTVPDPSASFEDELARAVRLCKRAKTEVQHLFNDLRLGKAVNAEGFRPLVDELTESVFRNPGALVSLARLKTKDDYSYLHSVATCALMVALARELGLGASACREAGMAGLLHDVGKALMPLEVLNKPGKLTDAEFDVMRTHPARGHALLQGGAASAGAMDVCLHHHERIDGTGYPDRLKGEQISRLARMGAICDVYDAVTSPRTYKAAWDPAESISRMASWAGHFDPVFFAAFVRTMGIYPTGSLVRLRSGRLAVVVGQHPKELGAPSVRVFFSTKSNLPIPITLLDLARKDANDAIVGRERRDVWNFPQLDTLWAGDAAGR